MPLRWVVRSSVRPFNLLKGGKRSQLSFVRMSRTVVGFDQIPIRFGLIRFHYVLYYLKANSNSYIVYFFPIETSFFGTNINKIVWQYNLNVVLFLNTCTARGSPFGIVQEARIIC